MYRGKRHLSEWDAVQDAFKNLVDRKIRERRRDERRVAEEQITKHQLRARKSVLPMRGVIALLDGCPCQRQHSSSGKH